MVSHCSNPYSKPCISTDEEWQNAPLIIRLTGAACMASYQAFTHGEYTWHILPSSIIPFDSCSCRPPDSNEMLSHPGGRQAWLVFYPSISSTKSYSPPQVSSHGPFDESCSPDCNQRLFNPDWLQAGVQWLFFLIWRLEPCQYYEPYSSWFISSARL